MKVTGAATLRGPVDRVYAALNDPAVLVRTIPGCERLERVGPDSYRATINAGVAAIRGSFSGEVHLTDQRAPHAFTLRAAGSGAPGTVSADVRVTLADDGGGMTLLSYDADAVVGGMVGGVGQRVLAGVARKTANEFFAAVDGLLTAVPAPALAAQGPAAVAGAHAGPSPADTAGRTAAPPTAPAQPVVPSPAAPVSPAPTVFTRPADDPGVLTGPAGDPGVFTRPAGAPAPAGMPLPGGFGLGMAVGAGIALLGALVGGLVAARAARRR